MADPQINIGINPVIAAASIRAVASDIQKGLSNVGIPIRVEPNIVAGRGGRNIDASTQRGTDVSILRKAAKKSKAEEALTRIFDAVAAQELKTLQSSQRLVDATEKLEGARAAAANGDRKAARQIGGYIAAVRNATLAHEENKERLNFLNETTAAAATSIGKSQAVLAGLAKQQLRLGGLQLDRNQLFAANIGVMPIRDERGVVVGERAQTDEEAERESARDAEIQKRINKQMQAEQQKSANFIREWNRTLREYNRAVSGAAAGVASAFDRDVAPRKKFLRGAATTVLAGSEKALESGDVDAAKKLKQRADLLLSNEKNFGNEEAKARTELKNRLAAQAAKIKEAERLQAQNNEKVRRQIEFVNAKTSLDQVAVQLASAKNRGDITAATATQKSANAIVENAREAGVNGRNLRVLNSILRNINKEANSLEGELRKQANAAKSTVSRQDAIDKIREAETLIAQNKIAEATASLEASRVAAANAKDPEGKREADRRIVAAQKGVATALEIQKQNILQATKKQKIAQTLSAGRAVVLGDPSGNRNGDDIVTALSQARFEDAKALRSEAIAIKNSLPQTEDGKAARAALTKTINAASAAIKKEEAAAIAATNSRLRAAKLQDVAAARSNAINAIAAANFDQARDFIRQVKFGKRDLANLGSSQLVQDGLDRELDNLRISYRAAVAKTKKEALERDRAFTQELAARQQLSDSLKNIRAKLDSQISSIRESFGGGRGGGGRRPPGGSPPGGGPPFDDRNLGPISRTLTAIGDRLKAANGDMQTFAERTGLAAIRLAAWSIPATFLFATFGALRSAVSEIINMDKELRRLTFFSIGSQSLEEFNSVARSTIQTSSALEKNFDSLINLSNRFGISISETAKAANTVARIGQQTFNASGQPSQFLEAVTGLVKLEGGALSAESAAELLNAALAQQNLRSEAALLVAAKLGTVSLQTSFDVERLATVFTRFSSAALNVQNLNIDQSLAISAIAAKTFGTNASRLGTVLRQVTTKILQSREELEKLTGIDIAAEGGQLKSFQTVIDVFKQVQKASRTLAVEPLTRLLGDTDQRSDIIALASVIDQVESAFRKYSNAAFVAENSSSQVMAFLSATELVAQDTSTAITRLQNAILGLVKSAGVTEIIKNLGGGLTSIIDSFSKLTESFVSSGAAAKSFGVIATLVLSRLAKGAAAATLSPLINFAENNREIRRLGAASFEGKDNKNLIDLTNRLQAKGLLTTEEAGRALATNNRIQEQILVKNAEIAAQKQVINKIEKSGVTSAKARNAQQSILNSLTAERTALLAQENKLQDQLVRKDSLRGNLLGKLAANASTIAGVASSLAILSGNETATNAGIGAQFGAQLGSIFGPKGVFVGAILGALAGSVNSIIEAFSGVDSKETKRGQELDVKQRILETRRANARAAEAQSRAILKRQEDEEKRVARQVFEALQKRRSVLLEIEAVENRINSLKLKGLNTDAESAQLSELLSQNALLSAQLSEREAAASERKLRIEQRLEDVELFGQATSIGLESLRQTELAIAKLRNASDATQIKIDFKFDKRAAQKELDALKLQLNIRESALADAKAFGTTSDVVTATRELAKARIAIFEGSTEELQVVVDVQQKLLDAAKEGANKIFEAYKSGADQLRSSAEESRKLLGDIFGLRLTSATQQNEIARVREGERFSVLPQSFNEQISDISKSLGLVANSIARIGVVGGIDARSNNFGQGQKGFQALNSDVQDVSKKFKELIQVQQQLITADSTELRLKEDNLKREIQALTDKIEQDKKLLSDQEKAVQAILSERRIELQKQKELISILDARIKKETEVGKLIINAPQEFVKNSTKLASSLRALFEGTIGGRRLGDRSRQLDADRSGDLSRQEIERNLPIVADILQERVRQLGKQFPSIVPEILKSLDFAAQAGIELIIPPELLSDIVARAPVTRPGQGGDIIRQREGAEAGANKALNAIEAENTRLINITGERIRLESALLDLEKNRRLVLEEQNNIFKNKELPEALDKVRDAADKVSTSLGKLETLAAVAELLESKLKSGSISIENFSAQLKKISDSINLNFDPKKPAINSRVEINPNREEDLALAKEYREFVDRMSEFAKNMQETLRNEKIDVNLDDLQVKLDHVIKLEFDGELNFAQFRENTMKAIEARIGDIGETVKKLVRIEVDRGTPGF